MCLHPITIPNPSHFHCSDDGDRVFVDVPCGHCSECLQSRHAEWYTRCYYQFLETLEDGGSCYFDTLTYRPESLPHLSDYLSDISPDSDVPCFSYDHIRLFMYRLRKMLLPYHVKFQVVSEYGSSAAGTHRPHYHLLLFLPPGLDSSFVSICVSRCWPHGRTDGLPYQNSLYVGRHTYKSLDGVSLRVASYVSKYVFKDPFYMDVVNDRVRSAVDSHFLGQVVSDRKRHQYERKVRYYTDPFHLQSIGFGVRYLRDVDVSDFKAASSLSVPHPSSVVLSSSLPTYFKRKMFYELIKIDGHYIWTPTSLGVEYLRFRDSQLVQDLSLRYQSFGFSPDESVSLADYVLFERGRFHRLRSYRSLLDKSFDSFVFPYLSPSDVEHFGSRFVSPSYLGLDGSYSSNFPLGVPFRDWCKSVIVRPDMERLLDRVNSLSDSRSVQLDEAFKIEYDLKHRLKAVLSPLP